MMNWIVSSTVLICVVIVLRSLLKGKISLRLQYALWAIVLVRLLIPISIGETAISVGNWIEQISQQKEVHEVYELAQTPLPSMSYQQAYQEIADKYANQGVDIAEMTEREFMETVEYEIEETMTGEWSFVEIVKFVWILGGVAVGFCFLFSNIRFQQRILKNRSVFPLDRKIRTTDVRHLFEEHNTKLPVYLCDEVETPCLFGMLHPAIYVTSEVINDEVVLRHVITHEITHYLHRDHIWGYARGLCLAVHWYNPLVWYAAILSRNDAELACDEGAIVRLGEMERASYGRTLIGLTCEKTPAVLLTATTMTGSSKSIKERITMLIKRPKMKKYVGFLVVLVSLLCVGCTFTGANSEEKKQDVVTKTDNTEAENIVIGSISEKEELREEEQEQLRIELELRQQEVEQQKEQMEKMAKFYQTVENGTLVMDADIKERVLQLILDEYKLVTAIESACEMNFENEIQVDGIPYYEVVEADGWNYYESIAQNYYSEEYLTEEFAKKYLEENKLFVEKNGKLYRTLADSAGFTFLEQSLNLWKTADDVYYATITTFPIAGGFFSEGYCLRLSENNIYGFVITDKLYLETNVTECTYWADLTHDGVNECIRVSIAEGNALEDAEAKISVYNDATLDVLYETELLVHPNLGEAYYLLSYEGDYYLMRYKASVNHEMASCNYEVFYLDNKGKKVPYDKDMIEISFSNVKNMDRMAWKEFANRENMYFKGGFLLADTNDGKLDYSTNTYRKTYTENFGWLIAEDTESCEKNLELFLKDVREMYDE